MQIVKRKSKILPVFIVSAVDFYSRKGIICGLYKRSVLLMNLGVHLG